MRNGVVKVVQKLSEFKGVSGTTTVAFEHVI